MCSRFVLIGLGIFVFGCGGSSAPEVAEPTPAPEPAAAVAPETAPEALDADTLANLAKADLKDGLQDKVVSKCGLCALHMDGSDDLVVTAGEYTLHMCSGACKSQFESDPEGSLAKVSEAVQ